MQSRRGYGFGRSRFFMRESEHLEYHLAERDALRPRELPGPMCKIWH